MTTPKLSVVLATYNEEANLARCLESVKTIADEIIIVDGESTDKTVKIAKNFKARVVVTTNPPVFHINKQKALELATGEWVLLLDADESLSPRLREEIQEVIRMSDEDIENRVIDLRLLNLFNRHVNLLKVRDGIVGTEKGPIVAFFMPRSNIFLGKFLKKGGQYPDFTLRMVKNGKGRYLLHTVHDQMQVDGRVSLLQHDLLHFGTPDFENYMLRFNRYTTLLANEFKNKNLELNVFNAFNYLLIKPFVEFFLLYFRYRGYVDGFPGFVFALFSGLRFAVAYIKFWQHTKYPENSKLSPLKLRGDTRREG